jgi:hypothetical protein
MTQRARAVLELIIPVAVALLIHPLLALAAALVGAVFAHLYGTAWLRNTFIVLAVALTGFVVIGLGTGVESGPVP